ncbi:MAG TPA: YbaB/EbfC family nucleoid-associated protein [Candidatus Woesebacteria bacterium]|nr:YbaB/EbfC family nucleoid-associated protein [Candidatus Woesebacteria bacterium]
MFNPLNAFGNIQKLQQQAKQMQAALQQEEITVEKNGVIVKVRGDQKIQEIEIDGVLENRVVEAINEAIKKTQEIAARKLMEIAK